MSLEAYRAHQERITGRPASLPSAIRPAANSGLPLKPDTQKEDIQKEDTDRWSRELALQIRRASLPPPILEYPFAKQLDGSGRGWRFDLCWPSWEPQPCACEVDGAVHRIKRRFAADIPKSQEALRLGYRVLRVTPADVRSGRALELVRELLTAPSSPAASMPEGDEAPQ